MAAESIRKNIILKAIGDKEGLSMSDEDFQTELEVAISNSGYTSVDGNSPEDHWSPIERSSTARKVMDFHKGKTTVTAPAAEEDPPALQQKLAEAARRLCFE